MSKLMKLYPHHLALLISLGVTSGCGGGGTDISQNPQTGHSTSEATLNVEENSVLNKRSSNTLQGIRRVTSSNGIKGFIFDPNLGIPQESKTLRYGAVRNAYTNVSTEQGETTYDVFLIAGGNNSTTNLPEGILTYHGNAIFRYEVSSPEYFETTNIKKALPRAKSGNAFITVNFSTGTGKISALSDNVVAYYGHGNDGVAELDLDIISIDQLGNISGSGTFKAAGDTWESSYWHNNLDASAKRIDPNDHRWGWMVTEDIPFTPISEQSVFQGALFGPNGEEVAGIAMGDVHQVGLSVAK